MFHQVALSTCIESDELIGCHRQPSRDPRQPSDVVIDQFDHAGALLSAERLFSPRNDMPGQWIPHKRFVSVPILGHLCETCQATTGSRFNVCRQAAAGEQPLEQDGEQLEQEERPLPGEPLMTKCG